MDQALLMIAAIFVLAGFVKGMLGLGMPTVAIGLLALSMPPARAIAITIVPAIITNIWQAFAGPYLKTLLIRLWPLFVCTAAGVLLGRGLMIGPYARYGTVLLGILLAVYAAIGLAQVRFHVTPRHEKWIGAVTGLATGIVSAATGIQVFPSMPYLAALGLGRDELVQALGIFFMTATTALIFNLNEAGLITSAIVAPAVVALVCAFIGMFIGQWLRERTHPDTFRRWFLIALFAFGIYLAGNAAWALLRA